jgi:hypothetical protein
MRASPGRGAEAGSHGRDLGEIYARADADGISTEQAAERLAVSHLG